MDEKEIELEEELEETTEEDLDEEDLDSDEAESEEDSEIEFETDEEGNVIIPEDEDENETAPATETEHETEAQKTEPDARDVENARLNAELKRIKSKAADMLKKMGVDEKDIEKGMAQLAAEAEDTPVDEYTKKLDEKLKEEAEAELAEMQKYEAMAKSDLEELKAVYPEMAGYKSIKDMPEDILLKFAKFRDLGMSAKEAYSAANPDGIRNAAATAAKKAVTAGNGKAHLKSNVPKGASGNSITIPKAELQSWMDDLGVSKEEAIRLYKKTMK